jgi:hypothetical protein
MIVQVFNRGSGGGSGPVDYLLGKGLDREGATLLRGDPEQVKELIDSSRYAKKYTSGVLSFQEENLPEKDKQALMDSFEKALLSGLEKDQYSILWVEHRDKDRLELNFVVPNVELQTGKRLQPYYDRADRPRINAWKDIQNITYGLHDPNDPANRQTLTRPKDLPRDKEAALEAINNGLLNLAQSGEVKSRDDVVKALTGAGFTVARQTQNSISIADPDGGKNIRLKGALYEQNFRFSTDLSAEISAASERYRNSVEDRLQCARGVYQEGFERKCGYHRERYPRPYEKPDLAPAKELADRDYILGNADSLGVGNDLVSGQSDIRKLPDDLRAESHLGYAGEEGRQNPIQHLHGSRGNEEPVMRQDADGIGAIRRGQRELHGFQGVLNDGVRENAVKRLRGFTEQLRTAAGAMAERAERLITRTKDLARAVYQYNRAEQPLERASNELNQAGDALSRASAAVEMKIEYRKELERERARERSKGWEL